MTKTVLVIERPKGTRKKGKKNRKWGRNKKKCEKYRKAQKHEKSHVSRLEKHLRGNPCDDTARSALVRYKALLLQ